MDLFFFSLVASQSPSSLPTLGNCKQSQKVSFESFYDCVVISLKLACYKL